MALGSTQPLTEMSTGVFPGGKGGRCVKLTTLPPSYDVVMKSGNLNFLESSGPLQACNGSALPISDYKMLQRVSTNYMVFLRPLVHMKPKLQLEISFWVSVICTTQIFVDKV